MLSDEQHHFFNTFGYLGFPGLLDDCKERIIEEFENVWKENGGGHGGNEHDLTKRSCLLPFPGRNVYLSSLLDDPRIHDIAADILGEDFNYTSGDGNYYSGDTNWHSDDYKGDRIPSIKIAFYLDSVTRDTGALRVIPGSHHCGDAYADTVEELRKDTDKSWGIHGSEVPSVALETMPGDIIVFWHNLKHAAFGGSERRRMFTMNFCEHVEDDRLEDLQNMLAPEGRFFIDQCIGQTMIDTAGPERMIHLQQIMANDFKIKEYHDELKAKGVTEPSRG
ncbi:MAG: phytanoyl-CoA dioxygenase family protein [Lentisphaeria bacterium]|nr:phytanoyl-CoA dioxygenase family protein [Lentisphaeria bacterium]